MISVGYRVKSQRGIEFRRWANKVLKDYIIKGCAINDKRLEALQKTVEIQERMLANTIEAESDDVLKAVNMYTQALQLLDQYAGQIKQLPEYFSSSEDALVTDDLSIQQVAEAIMK